MTWDRLETWGLGWMGMTIDEMYDMTFRQFFNRFSGFQQLREMDSRERWEIARLHAATLLNAWVSKSIQPRELWKLKWDSEGLPEPTAEGLEDFKKRFGEKL